VALQQTGGGAAAAVSTMVAPSAALAAGALSPPMANPGGGIPNGAPIIGGIIRPIGGPPTIGGPPIIGGPPTIGGGAPPCAAAKLRGARPTERGETGAARSAG